VTARKTAGFAAEKRAAFEATLFQPDATEKVASGVLLALPQEVSANLLSRGMALVEGTINGAPFQAVLEPDGRGSHWLKVSEALRAAANAEVGDTITLAIAPTKDWPEPTVPQDLTQALAVSPEADALWEDITPMARWDWIRWIGATRNPQTRQRRVDVAIDKLTAGKRRPCCFDRKQCTLTDA
jgi:Bacteriocin-protection, YdeI or OmpD-Associated/Domain of unknown function (DUF1905)